MFRPSIEEFAALQKALDAGQSVVENLLDLSNRIGRATVYIPSNTFGDAMNEATFTFRVDGELKDSFATAAKARDRTGAQLLRDFMREFVQKQQDAVEHDVWSRRQVQFGLDSADAGKLVPAEEVEAEFAKRRERTRQKLNAKS